MAGGSRPTKRQAAGRRQVMRRRAFAAAILTVALALVVWFSSRSSPAHPRSPSANVARTTRPDPPGTPERFATRRLPFGLPVAKQDTAAVSLGAGRVALLGGLDPADTSTAAVSVLDARRVVASAQLPEPQHDAQGALIDGPQPMCSAAASSAPTTTSSTTTPKPAA